MASGLPFHPDLGIRGKPDPLMDQSHAQEHSPRPFTPSKRPGCICLVLLDSIIGGERMTCEQARSDAENKKAVAKFSELNEASLSKTHEFLRNSDYSMRNIVRRNEMVTFVYAANFYPSTCGLHIPGIDGGIVRVNTEVKTGLQIVSVE